MAIIKVVQNKEAEELAIVIKKLVDLKNLAESWTIKKYDSKRKAQLHRFNHLLKRQRKDND